MLKITLIEGVKIVLIECTQDGAYECVHDDALLKVFTLMLLLNVLKIVLY
jgi:hypothetical protein